MPLAESDKALIAGLRAEARNCPESGIVEVFNYGRTRPGLIPLWAGEGDLATPSFICDAATRSLAAGETFYTYQRGLPELRAALAAYHEAQFGRPFSAERFFITGGGMQAIQLAFQATAGAGDSVVIHTPAWPNAAAAAGLVGARVVSVPSEFSIDGWSLDLQKLFDACDGTTRAIFLNSPCNPTGWVATKAELRAVLDFARSHGIWIIADEIYSRFVFAGERSPSFRDVAEDDDRILYVNTFSKNWAMTGWRIGWIEIPEALGQVFENLIQYNTSGVAAFMQRAAFAALEQGGAFVEHQIRRVKEGRQVVCGVLSKSNRVEMAWPGGAFYAFFAIAGEDDTAKLGLKLVDEANVGIAPGTAFGPGGDRFIRLCFARKADDLAEAARRLSHWLGDGADQ